MESFGLVMIILVTAAHPVESVRDVPFVQETREVFAFPDGGKANDVRGIAVDGQDRVWAATGTGIFRLDGERWTPLLPDQESGPAFTAETDGQGRVWIGAWNGLYTTQDDGSIVKVTEVTDSIGAIGVTASGIVAMGPYGMWHNRDGGWKHERGTWADSPKAIACEENGDLWVATGHGLFRITGTTVAEHLRKKEELLTGVLSGAALGPDGRLWVGGLGGIDVFTAGQRTATLTTAEGLPHPTVQKLRFAPDGVLWVCTQAGVARYDGTKWSLRHSLRWLPSDDTRDVAFDKNLTAWVATANGVSAIRRRMMTLEDKAKYFENIVMTRKVREPWLVEKSRLLKAGDLTTWRTEDDDNDGSYTAMYMIAEGFRYAVTKEPEARNNALRAFEAIEFLQTVTGTPGFIARTVIPVWWTDPARNDNPHRVHDSNRTYTAQERAEAHVRDPRDKPVEERWRPSADGRWLWKGDTSSDEITGHFWGFLYFYDLVAETEEEKERVRSLARRVMDHIIDGGFVLNDTDGTHTRWGVWSPEKLLGDADWQAERPINATEMLSYLNVTHYLTGDTKYREHCLRLANEFGYAELARAPKPTAPSELTHIDAELLAMVFPGLIKCEPDDALRAKYVEGLHEWFAQVRDEHSPFFSLVAAAWGVDDVAIEPCVDYLRDAPLDNIHWTVDNTVREDLKLVRLPELEPLQTDRLPPPSERDIMRWDKNPWAAVQGDGGNTEGATVYWLFPYWMGRYYGFIGAPDAPDATR